MKYKHTQVGYVMILVSVLVALLFLWSYFAASKEPPSTDSGTNFVFTATMVLITLLLLSFTSLTVAIDAKYVRIKFGFGIYRKKLELSKIKSAKIVKNHWYYGWGIRFWLWPKMVIFNVSGLSAVEVKLKNSQIYRIGTDEPAKLESAILEAISSTKV